MPRRYSTPREPPVPGREPIRAPPSACGGSASAARSRRGRPAARTAGGAGRAAAWRDRARGPRARRSAACGRRAAARRRGTRPTARALAASISRNWRDWKPLAGVSRSRNSRNPRDRMVSSMSISASSFRSIATTRLRPGTRPPAGRRAARRRPAELVQQQLEPQLVGLVDDDEQQLVVRARRQRALQLEQVVDQQVGGVLGAAGRPRLRLALHPSPGLPGRPRPRSPPAAPAGPSSARTAPAPPAPRRAAASCPRA